MGEGEGGVSVARIIHSTLGVFALFLRKRVLVSHQQSKRVLVSHQRSAPSGGPSDTCSSHPSSVSCVAMSRAPRPPAAVASPSASPSLLYQPYLIEELVDPRVVAGRHRRVEAEETHAPARWRPVTIYTVGL